METKPIEAQKEKYVSVDKFNKLTSVLETLVSTVTELKNRPVPTVAETKEELEIKKVAPDKRYVNPVFEETAREILGEMMDYCYQAHDGNTFAVVIKEEFSNAPKDYLGMYKLDIRSKPLGNEGVSGVESFCKLVRSNLKRAQAK
jgi:hypothetical protein